jgi:hypothetical protein
LDDVRRYLCMCKIGSDLIKQNVRGHRKTQETYLGVKWSRVQILSARPEFPHVRGILTYRFGRKLHTPPVHVAQRVALRGRRNLPSSHTSASAKVGA